MSTLHHTEETRTQVSALVRTWGGAAAYVFGFFAEHARSPSPLEAHDLYVEAIATEPALDESRHYHEAHITVEPDPGMTFAQFRDVTADDEWRTSTFAEDDVDQIQGKWFITCRHVSRSAITEMVRGMVEGLTHGGLTVLRWKIEDTLLDSKYGDTL